MLAKPQPFACDARRKLHASQRSRTNEHGQRRPDPGRGVLAEAADDLVEDGQVHAGGGQRLDGVVVQVAGQAAPLLLLGGDELAQKVAALALDPNAVKLGEGGRFAFCTPEGLSALCREAELPPVTIAPIEIETRFASFEDLWQPFTLGAGPAPGYCVSLPEEKRAALKERLRQDVGGDGPVSFTARAWAVKAAL